MTPPIAPRVARLRRRLLAVLLLIAGDLVGVPYFVLVRALHSSAGEGSALLDRFRER